MTVKKLFGYSSLIVLAVVVLAFLGLHSLTFFEFTFPPDQYYYAYLGFGLTSGAVVGYLIMLVTISDTPLKKFIALVMLGFSIVGEIFTAGFGMQVEAWREAGFAMTQEDFTMMIRVVQVLMLVHGIAVVGHFGGDAVFRAFSDQDGDGIPNLFDRDYKPEKQQFRTFPAETALVNENTALKARIAELEGKNPSSGRGQP